VTTPIVNKLQESISEWTPDYLRAMTVIRERRGKTSLVDYHKAKLGRQQRTFNGEYRYWVWETGTWTIYVSNIKGVGFEVAEMFSKRHALEAWADYKERMGIA
jgi:hypothetical protein